MEEQRQELKLLRGENHADVGKEVSNKCRVLITVNTLPYPLTRIPPGDGEELRAKDKMINGENHTQGIPSYWWQRREELSIQFWPSARNEHHVIIKEPSERYDTQDATA